MWLKFRNLTLRILAATVILGQQAGSAGHMNNGVGNGAGKSMPEILFDLLEQLKKHIEECKEFCSMPQYPLQGPYPTQLSNYLSTEHCHIFVDMIENILYIHSLHEDGLDKIDNEKEERLKDSVPKKLESMVTRHKCSLVNSEDGRNCINTEILGNIVYCTETISNAVIIAGACHRILKPLKSKKSKKRKGGPPQAQAGVFDHYTMLLKGLEKATKDLHEAVRDIDPVFLSLDLSSLSLTQPLCDTDDELSVEKEVWKKVERSYQQSSREVSELLHNKLQYLTTLQL